MREDLLRKGLVLGIILLFVGTSIPVSNAILKESSEETKIANDDIENCIELFDEEAQKYVNQALFNRVEVFVTVSSGLGYTYVFPIFRRYDKPYLCCIVHIDYTRSGSLTRIRKIGDGIVDSASGPHELFFVGIGSIYMESRGFFLPDSINFVGISFTKPIIK